MLLKAAKAEQAAEEAEAEGKAIPPPPGSTLRSTRSPNKRPFWVPAQSRGPRTYSQPDGVANRPWVGWARSKAPNPIVSILASSEIFDSTRGFPGEGPSGPASTPWFLDETSTRHLHDRKRWFSEPRLEPTIIRPEGRRLAFGSSHHPRQAPQVGNGSRRRSDTALGRFLPAQDLAGAKVLATPRDITPVPRNQRTRFLFFLPQGSSGIFSPLSPLSPPVGLYGRDS